MTQPGAVRSRGSAAARDRTAAQELERLVDENARLARELADQEARHRFLLDRLPDVMWAAGADRVFTYVSAGCERILGYRPEELIGRGSEIVMHPSSVDAFNEGYRWQMAHPDADQTYRVNLRHKDGHPVPVELHNIGTPVDGRYGGGTGSVREISDRLRLEQELQEQAAELAAGRERARLAQELHDSVTQALFSMTITAGTVRMMLEEGRPGVEAKLDDLSTLARQALTDMRSLIFELRPANLAEEGLLPALRKHAAAVEGRTGLGIGVSAASDLERLPAPMEEALFRIAQEAIHNVVKHAHARHVQVAIGRQGAEVRMEVRDDGDGFDPRQKSDGLGLLGIASRAERLGGRLGVESSAKGTRISVSLPIA
jgi:PAS domain S-box-containing protein